MSLGSTGTPLARLTWVPARPSRAPPTVDIFAGGVTEGLALGEAEAPLGEGLLGEGLGAASATGAVSARDDRAATEVTSRDRPMVFFWGADTFRNVHGAEREVPPPSPPRTPNRTLGRDTGPMKLSRPVSWFLLAFGVWSWIIWITFVKNLVKDASGLAFDDAGDPTGYFWVHLLLAVVSFVLGTVVGLIGLRGLRALRGNSQPTPES